MDRRRLALMAVTAALGLFLGAPGHAAMTQTNPGVVISLERGGTITAGGAAQNAMTSNPIRKGWCIQNDPSATETLFVRTDAIASATTGTALAPGQQVCSPASVVTSGVISVYAVTTGHRWYGVEFQ